jgi:hypothetical protein
MNDINDEGMKLLSSVIATRSLGQLTELDLEWNKIDDGGIQAFASVVGGTLCQLINLNITTSLKKS